MRRSARSLMVVARSAATRTRSPSASFWRSSSDSSPTWRVSACSWLAIVSLPCLTMPNSSAAVSRMASASTSHVEKRASPTSLSISVGSW